MTARDPPPPRACQIATKARNCLRFTHLTRIDKKSCQIQAGGVQEVQVIESAQAAAVALEPIRSRLLAELKAPASAAALATRVGLTRQKVHYHLKALEAHGLVEVAETRLWGGLTEKLMVAKAQAFVVSPGALGEVGVDPERHGDRLSASYLIALAGRAIREVGQMLRLAGEQGKRLASLSIDTEIRFRSAAERAAFTQELAQAIAALAAKYHDAEAPGGREHRVVLFAHPLMRPEQEAP